MSYPSIRDLSEQNRFKPQIAKQNTDYLFARQLSEEMESTIVGIQPGGKASNFDKLSKNSSELQRPPTIIDSNRIVSFCANNQDFNIEISPIGEHGTDEDESSKMASNFTSTNLKEHPNNINIFNDAVELQEKANFSEQSFILDLE